MSGFLIGNIFLAMSLVLASVSQVALKGLLNRLDSSTLSLTLLREQDLGFFGMLLLIGVMIVAGFLFWTFSLTKLNLSYAYPIACSSALLVALLSAFLLGEAVTVKTWLGTGMIVVGTALLVPVK
jgi:drug/metabolite transporter (DMT)-like permease